MPPALFRPGIALTGIMQRAIILDPVFNRSYSRPRLTGLVLHNFPKRLKTWYRR